MLSDVKMVSSYAVEISSCPIFPGNVKQLHRTSIQPSLYAEILICVITSSLSIILVHQQARFISLLQVQARQQAYTVTPTENAFPSEFYARIYPLFLGYLARERVLEHIQESIKSGILKYAVWLPHLSL